MKILILFLLLILCFSAYPQNDSLICGNSAISISGNIPSNTENFEGVTGIPVGGREITNQGIFRVLVIFVRFKDDITNTTNWPDYNVLPSWAENIIDDQIPVNNIYTPGNISDFMDRASGGDGSGSLGIFKVIGDVYYVTTDENESYYGGSYSLINSHVVTKLNNQIDYSLYDNWKFMKDSEYYNHEYLPGVGDGKIDYIMFFNRANHPTDPAYAAYKGYYIPSNFYLDGKLFNGYGSTQFGYKNHGNFKVTITIPVHEFTHYIFGGLGNISTHLDGRINYINQFNIGNVEFFALMLRAAGANSFYSAYERYRAGWLNPTVLSSSQSSMILQDTHKKHKAFLIPVRQDITDPTITAEYYLIENFQTVNSYSSANPFLTTSVFNFTFDHGLLVFHIEQEDYNIATNSNLDIECADGLWDFYLTAGTNTPADREDDVLRKNTTSRISGFDERDAITLTVGSITYYDYYCLTPSSCGSTCPTNHGRRYYEDAFLGDNDDFFRNDGVKVFSSWSNPQLCLASGSNIYKGIEIKNYYTDIREYELSFQSGYDDVLSLSPSKPQNIKVSITSDRHPKLTWDKNLEPDMSQYKVYRSTNPTTGFTQIGTATHNPSTPTITYIDYTITVPLPREPQGTIYYYRVTARDNQPLESVKSDYVSAVSNQISKNIEEQNEIAPSSFLLFDNYPNPFNPRTTISFSIPERSFVTLKVYDMLGREVAELVNEELETGSFEKTFEANNLASGVYIYRISAMKDGKILFNESKQMLLIK